MAFDLALIASALDRAVGDAEDSLAERHRNYAGYPGVGKLTAYAHALECAKHARAEFARLRRAIEDAPLHTVERRVLRNEIAGSALPVGAIYTHVDLIDHRVLLVKADDP